MTNQKTVLITGGNTGIGKQIALTFAKNNFHVIITSRDASNGEDAAREIIDATKNKNVSCIQGDLSSIKGCYALVEKVKSEISSLQVLINNAGVTMMEKVINEDGFELTFMVNYLAPYILSTGLTPLLKQNNNGRIINVNTSARMQGMGKLNIETTPFGSDFKPGWTYNNTKLANAMMTVTLAEQLLDSGITVNALYPGLYKTKNSTQKLNSIFMRLIMKIIMLREMSLAIAGEAPYQLATDEALTRETGQFFHMKDKSQFTKKVYDPAERALLYRKTIAWLGAAS
ncbi:SDR family NAD(P)-dependent oxidoreductase [Dyadobacter diqingensis]|uniref:SDR family NAD(P)-dependent oxidoreductase n=1 Tax=Dyadobacter diqingensis TaxID=2938121 RepID=UPI0020C19D4A|nr:SDR family NAD(P)-dependent oxidoreductase [Dyadobacter diqingensis]